MPRCIRCAIDGDDVTMHNGAWVHRAPGICFKKLRDVVESLQQERTGLRAELDAIKGAQRGVKFIAHNDIECTARFADGKYNITWQHGELGPMTLDAMYKTWPHLKAEERAALEALRHPAPALPVVGACVVEDGKPLVTYTNTVFGTQADKEAVAMDVAKSMGATAHIVHLGAPLPTEGGK